MNAVGQAWKQLIWWQKALAMTGSIFVLYLLFGFLLLPPLVRFVLEDKVAQALDRRIDVASIRFNPLTLTTDLTGLTVREKDGDAEFAGVDEIHANLELSSLPRLALVIRDVHLTAPRLHIRLDREGRTNFADLTATEPAPAQPDAPMLLPLIVEPFTVTNGTLTFADEARNVSHIVDLIHFELPHFSSRKKDWETFMTPTLSFRANGAPFNLEGRTTPFSNSLKTEFDLNVVDLGLPQYWAYAMARENLQLAKGLLNLQTRLAFEQHEDSLPTFSLQGEITGHDIELTDNNDPVFSASRLHVVMDDISILNLRLGLQSVELEQPFLRIVRTKEGSLNWGSYFAAGNTAHQEPPTAPAEATGDFGNATAASPEPETRANATLAQASGNATETDTDANATDQQRETAAILLLQAPKITLTDGRILFRDDAVGFAKDIGGVNLTVTDLDTSPNATSHAGLTLHTVDGEEISVNASFSVAPLGLWALIEARALDLPSYSPYFQDALPLTLTSAKAGARLHLSLESNSPALRLEDASFEVQNLTLKADDGSGEIKFDQMGLNKIHLDPAANTIKTGLFRLKGAHISTALDTKGRARLLDALNRPDTARPAPASADRSEAAAWKINLEGAVATGLVVKTGDKTAPTPAGIASLQIGPVAVDTGGQSVQVGPVDLKLAVDVVRQAGGEINLATLFAPANAAPASPKSAAKTSKAASPWNVTVDQVSLSDSAVTFTDQTVTTPLRLSVDQIALSAKSLSTDLAKSIPLILSCRVGETGVIKAAGDIVPASTATTGNLELSRIPLSLAAPYVADLAAVDIPAGRLGGKLAWRMGGKEKDQISGSLLIDGLRVTEGRTKQEILGFKTLGVGNLQLRLSPLALTVAQVDLVEPRGSFLIDAQGKTTMDRIAPTGTKPPIPQTRPAAQAEGIQALEIGTIKLSKGRFTFADQTLSPHFQSVIAPVDVNVTDVSLDPAKQSRLEVTAVIDGSAPINIQGWVAPLKNPVEADSTVTLRNLDLVALSPYSSKFIAYPITRGQLDWDMNVRTEASNLAMGNAIKARQLELGDKVESPDAVDAPVKLGLALLRDMSGNIAINLPVKGDLSDPKFSIGGIVMQAFLGLIVKAVASPFSLLASLVPGGGGEDLNHLLFPPGQVEPGPETVSSVRSLADILMQRPAINISIQGHADPVADRQAMADRQFTRKLQRVKYDDLPRKARENTILEELEITDEEYPDLLWEAYKKEPVDKEKNALGMHREVSREIQEAKLRELIQVTDEDLVRLAAGRAELVKNQLVGELGVDANRVFMGQTGPRALSGRREVTVEIQP